MVYNPVAVGTQRIDVNKLEKVYQAKIKSAFYAVASDDAIADMGNLLVPDEPLQPVLTPIVRTQQMGCSSALLHPLYP